MIPCIVATFDQPSTVIESIGGEVVARTVGVHITVECPVDHTAAGHAALTHAVAQIRRQLDVLDPPRPVLVPGPEGAQDE